MKKKLLILIMIMCLLMTPLAAWADSATYSTGETATPWYTTVAGINTILNITSGGTAQGAVTVQQRDANPFDYSKITVYLKKSSGTTVKTWTATKYPNSMGYFNWSGSYDLTSKGTYYLEAKNKLYQDDELIETITTTSVYQTY